LLGIRQRGWDVLKLSQQVSAKGKSGGESSTGGKKAATIEQKAPPSNKGIMVHPSGANRVRPGKTGFFPNLTSA